MGTSISDASEFNHQLGILTRKIRTGTVQQLGLKPWNIGKVPDTALDVYHLYVCCIMNVYLNQDSSRWVWVFQWDISPSKIRLLTIHDWGMNQQFIAILTFNPTLPGMILLYFPINFPMKSGGFPGEASICIIMHVGIHTYTHTYIHRYIHRYIDT